MILISQQERKTSKNTKIGPQRLKLEIFLSMLRSMGAKYTMGAADFRVTSQKVVGGNKYSSIGVKYTVAPGLAVILESGEQEDQTATYAHIGIAF